MRIYILEMIILLIRIFHISISRWFFTGVWVTASLPQVSRTRLRILAVLSNAVVWIVSIRPPTSKSSGPFNYPLVIVPKAPITMSTIVSFMFYSFFNSLARSRYLFFFSLPFRLYSVVHRDGKVANFANSLFVFVDLRHSLERARRRHWPPCQCTQNGIYVLQPNRWHFHTRWNLSETSRQIHTT